MEQTKTTYSPDALGRVPKPLGCMLIRDWDHPSSQRAVPLVLLAGVGEGQNRVSCWGRQGDLEECVGGCVPGLLWLPAVLDKMSSALSTKRLVLICKCSTSIPLLLLQASCLAFRSVKQN
jgi:hypothetical protein